MPTVIDLQAEERSLEIQGQRALKSLETHREPYANKRRITAEEQAKEDEFYNEVRRIEGELKTLRSELARGNDVDSLRQRLGAPLVGAAQATGGAAQANGEGRETVDIVEDSYTRQMLDVARIQSRTVRYPNALGEMEDVPLSRLGFWNYLKTGRTNSDAPGSREFAELQQVHDSPEQRDLVAGVDTAGGFMVAPPEFYGSLLREMTNSDPVRGLATVITIGFEQEYVLPLVGTLDKAQRYGENEEIEYDESEPFDERRIRPARLGKAIKISRSLLRAPGPNVEAEILRLGRYSFTNKEAEEHMTGAGTPHEGLGLFTAQADGIPSTQDVNTGEATDLTKNAFHNVAGKLHTGYKREARWMMHPDIVTAVRKLDNATGQASNAPLWQPSFRLGNPNLIAGYPYEENYFAPNSFAADKYAAIFGNFRYMYIVQWGSMEIGREVEMHLRKNQVGIVLQMFSKAAPVMKDAFVRMKFHS